VSVVAFCAPGKEPLAWLILALRSEHVDDVKASPILEGGDTILVVTDPEPLDLPPFQFHVAGWTPLDQWRIYMPPLKVPPLVIGGLS